MEEIHLGIIPDGNRRWARKRGLEPWKGHIYGAKKFEEFFKWCVELGIKKVSFYLLSYENMIKRSKKELENIFKLLENYLEKWEREKLYEKYEVKVNFLGNFRKVPKSLVKLMLRISRKSLKFSKRILNILIGYSGTYDVIQAVKKMVKNKVKITEKNLKNFLLVNDDVDLIIRTGGYSRLSNFLPLQSSYAEIYVLNKYWPDITKKDLIKALNWYKKLQRNFGK
jgi:tritrans,polycis-undecaprenyl-diphosphate synthase [geranylgeranyl-diphosphate specific]